MATYESDFLHVLSTRGFVRQITDAAALDRAAAQPGLTAYIGFDATAPSLHVGSLLQIMMLRHLQRCGGVPIVLIGGGTTRVGDPSERAEQRPLLSPEQIAANTVGLKRVFDRFLRFGDRSTDARMADNAEWLCALNYLEFLRDYGRHFSVNTMIRQDTVARRLREEKPYTFLEFNYVLLQAYDFLELLRRNRCRLQLGGSDQWGNIVAGVELCRRIAGEQVFGLTAPLVTTSSGTKMGKTADGAVWLNADLCGPYEYWQFWRNTDDADVGRFLRLFTEIDLEEIERLEALKGAELNMAKIALADAATGMLHGEQAATGARAAAGAVFGDGATAAAMPGHAVDRQGLVEGLSLVAVCVAAGLASSRSEARRLMRAGAVRLNTRPVTDIDRLLVEQDLRNGEARLSMGKKRHVRLFPSGTPD